MPSQGYGSKIGNPEYDGQYACAAHTDAERTRQGKKRSERFGNLVETRALRARRKAQTPLGEARGGISGQRHRGKDDSQRHGVAEKSARQSAGEHGGDETAPGLVISQETPSIAQHHAGIDGRGEPVAEEISAGPG